MIASSQFGAAHRRDAADEALARLPGEAFGDTDWARLALRSCAAYLEPAIRAGQPYRIANAIRAIAHAPAMRQVDAVAGAVCDALLAEAYAARNSRLVAGVAEARSVIDGVLAELGTSAERAAADSGTLREQVAGFVRLVALGDAALAERLEATGALAARIAVAMKLDPATVLDVELAGSLADIGMAGVPAETRSERERIVRHALAGETFVRQTPALSRLAPIVRSHYERYDGLGYPDALGGDEIPLESRIIGVAAAFIDLVTPAAHAKALLPGEAAHELELHAGAEFDPAIVTATSRLLQFRRRTKRSA